MDLKIMEVAELLNVSETTIRRWVTAGKIPAYQINRQYRFSRMEIEDWVFHQKMDYPEAVEQSFCINSTSKVTAGSNQFSLYRALNKGGIYYDLAGDNKEQVIQNATTVIAQKFSLDEAVLTDLLLDRERLMPTALNNGIGVPHTRDFLLETHFDLIALVFPQKHIDYGALDGIAVHSLFFLFASEDKRHLHLLAKIAHLVAQTEILDLLKSHATKTEILDYVKQWESTIHLV